MRTLAVHMELPRWPGPGSWGWRGWLHAGDPGGAAGWILNGTGGPGAPGPHPGGVYAVGSLMLMGF